MENPEIKIGSKTNQVVKCSQCQKEVNTSECYTYKGKKGEEIFLCETCREIAEKAFKEETKNPNMVMAFVFAVVAALAAGVAWFYITIITSYQIGYIAIGVGFLIGFAVLHGSGKKRGAPLQIMSAAMTLVTLFVSQYFIVLHYTRVYLLEHRAEYGYNGEWFFISPFHPDMLKQMFSPIGLVIWAVGIYFAYSLPKQRTI